MTYLDKRIRNIAMASWLVPAGCVLLCVTYVLRARLALGVWPEYNRPDPKTLGWLFHHLLIFFSLVAVYPALVLSAGISIYLFVRRHWRPASLILLTTLAIYVYLDLLAATAEADNFFAWYID